MRTQRAGQKPARFFTKLGSVAVGIALAAAPLSFVAAAPANAQSASFVSEARGGQSVADFYRARGGRPLWFGPGSGLAANRMVDLLNTAGVDGLDRNRYGVKKVAKAVRSAARGDARSVQRADMMLSNAYVAYARDLRRAPNIGIIYVDPMLSTVPSPRGLLEGAASAPSLDQFVEKMGWMNPTYGELRQVLLRRGYANEQQRQTIALNLERARALPGGSQRYIVVNAAAQRLYMYQGGQVVDHMRVVVGKANNQTPMMAALIRFTSLNPYWNVPSDLAAERIAPNVLKGGMTYLRTKGYQVLSDWSDNAKVVDPKTVDWEAVADGRTSIRVRQLPGPSNAMGKMKFMFPNRQGIYLHDTPDDELFSEASRLFSGGCVRLEDAKRLAVWLYGKPLKPKGAKAEQKVPLPTPVPVHLTYLTAVPSGSQLAYFADIYGRDAARLAQMRGARAIAARR